MITQAQADTIQRLASAYARERSSRERAIVILGPESPEDWPDADEVNATGTALVDYLKSLTRPITWAEAERISDLPLVDEAFVAFVDDATADNATGVVLAVLEAVTK